MPMFGKGTSEGIFSLAGDQPGSALHLVAVGGDYLAGARGLKKEL